MIASGDLNFSFSGLKTAALTLASREDTTAQNKADIAAAFQAAIVEVLVAKSTDAVSRTGVRQLLAVNVEVVEEPLDVALALGADGRALNVLEDALQRHV